jgi:hypothetical protein
MADFRPRGIWLNNISAPWRRLMFVDLCKDRRSLKANKQNLIYRLLSGLGTLPPKSLPMLDTNPQWPYFSRNVGDEPSSAIVERMIKQHLTCERILASGSENPFQRDRDFGIKRDCRLERDFQLVFFETLDEKNAAEETTWKMGELFQDPTVVTSESNTKPFRRSAFSVRNLHYCRN